MFPIFRDLMQKSFNIETNSIMSRATVIRHNDLRGLPEASGCLEYYQKSVLV